MQIEQLSLLSHGLEPLQLGQRVRVTAEDYDGVIAQVWPGRDWYAVYSVPWRGPMDKGLPIYRRDELEALPLLDDEAERLARLRIAKPELLMENEV